MESVGFYYVYMGDLEEKGGMEKYNSKPKKKFKNT